MKMPRSHFNLNNQINQTPQTLLVPQCKTWDQLPGCRFCIQTCRHQTLRFYHFRISIDFEHWTGVDISLNIADFICSCKVTNILMVMFKTVSSKGGCYDLIIRWWRCVQVQVLLFVDVIFFLYIFQLSMFYTGPRENFKPRIQISVVISSYQVNNS